MEASKSIHVVIRPEGRAATIMFYPVGPDGSEIRGQGFTIPLDTPEKELQNLLKGLAKWVVADNEERLKEIKNRIG
jgi:hypothetical protein